MTPDEVAEQFGQALMRALEKSLTTGVSSGRTLLSVALALQSELGDLALTESAGPQTARLLCDLGGFAHLVHNSIQKADDAAFEKMRALADSPPAART
jgi:hypothetical protein